MSPATPESEPINATCNATPRHTARIYLLFPFPPSLPFSPVIQVRSALKRFYNPSFRYERGLEEREYAMREYAMREAAERDAYQVGELHLRTLLTLATLLATPQ
jgi:hypothetical protein